MRDAGLSKAIKTSGGVSALARLCGVKQQSVQQWTRIPIEHLEAIHAATKLPLHELRPDAITPETVKASAASIVSAEAA